MIFLFVAFSFLVPARCGLLEVGAEAYVRDHVGAKGGQVPSFFYRSKFPRPVSFSVLAANLSLSSSSRVFLCWSDGVVLISTHSLCDFSPSEDDSHRRWTRDVVESGVMVGLPPGCTVFIGDKDTHSRLRVCLKIYFF